MLQQVSDFELELMKTIWGNGGSALYAEIVEALETKGTPAAKNTIISLLSRLIKKGYLSSRKSGRQNTYTALVTETQYQSEQTETFLKKVYEGNAEGLISTDDYEKLKMYWGGGR